MRTVDLTRLYRGDPRIIVVTVVDENADPVDLSGSTWSSTVREFYTSTTGLPLAVDDSQAAAGALMLTLSGEQSRCLGRQLVGDLEGSTMGTILAFTTTVHPDTSRGLDEPIGGVTDNITLVWSGAGLVLQDVVPILLMPGAEGPPGVPGPAGGSFSFLQDVPASVWTINHALGFKPNVDTFDTPGDQVEGDVFHVSYSQCTITFAYPTTGTAVLS